MIHPSYVELMRVVNKESVQIGEEPVVNSRYSIVIAASRRARQIIAGDEPLLDSYDGMKPLSIAVEELNQGYVKILSDEDEDEFVFDEDFSDEDYSDEDFSDEDYSEKDYSEEDFSEEDFNIDVDSFK